MKVNQLRVDDGGSTQEVSTAFMISIRGLRRRMTALVGVGIFFLAGCSGTEPTKSTPPPLDSESAEQRAQLSSMLDRFRTSYVGRDLETYADLFREDFRFVFDPQDVAENPDIPDYWFWHDEMQSTGNMFEEDLIKSISLDFVAGTDVPATEGDEGNWEFPPGTRKVTLSEVELRVVMIDPDGGEDIVYQVTGDQAVLFLVHDALDLAGSWRGWKILEWRDRRIGAAPTIDLSWGQVKNLFR